MATALLKDLTRESTEQVDGKEIVVTLMADQTIELKLKGKRGSGKTISIKDLYAQLYGDVVKDSKEDGPISIVKSAPKRGDNKMISLYDLRSQNAISMLDMETLAKFDHIIKNVIDSYKS